MPVVALVVRGWGRRHQAEQVEHLDQAPVVALEAVLVHEAILVNEAVPVHGPAQY
jgi:hypothetical protein